MSDLRDTLTNVAMVWSASRNSNRFAKTTLDGEAVLYVTPSDLDVLCDLIQGAVESPGVAAGLNLAAEAVRDGATVELSVETIQ